MAATALFTGRFQPPSIAHAATAKTILTVWSSLIIGISVPVDGSEFDPAWQPFLDATRDNFGGSKAVFTPHEVQTMWKAWIAHAGVTKQVACELAPRPHLPAFAERYPASQFDMVYPSPHESDSTGDQRRHELFPKLLGRKVFLVEPPFRLHNAQIKQDIRSSLRTWENSIAPGAFEIFMTLNGPMRMSQ